MPRPREVSVGIQENPQGDAIVLVRCRIALPHSLPPLDPDQREVSLARREKARREIEKRIAAAIASVEV